MPPPTAAIFSGTGPFARLVAFCGAGIYEELLFRLMLLPVVCGLVRLTGLQKNWSIFLGVIVTSLLFSAAHYKVFGEYGEPFQWYSFTFRVFAGLFFGLLFLFRGFGVAVGAHAFYDVFVVMVYVSQSAPSE